MLRATERPAAVVRRLLTTAVRDPVATAHLPARELDLTLRLVRRVRLLGRLAAELQQRGLVSGLPSKATEQLESALIAVEGRSRITRWELDRLAWALSRSLPRASVVVLKGCTCLVAG